MARLTVAIARHFLTMSPRKFSEAESKLDQFFQMPLYAREATWFEVVDRLEEAEEFESLKRPAPRTLQFSTLPNE